MTKKLKVIVTGSTKFNSYKLLAEKLDNILKRHLPNVVIVSGGSIGTDLLAEKYAKKHSISKVIMPKNRMYGNDAIHQRNLKMAKYADACIVFCLDNFKDTRDMLDIAAKEELKLRIIKLTTKKLAKKKVVKKTAKKRSVFWYVIPLNESDGLKELRVSKRPYLQTQDGPISGVIFNHEAIENAVFGKKKDALNAIPEQFKG